MECRPIEFMGWYVSMVQSFPFISDPTEALPSMDPPWINGEHSFSPSDLSFYNLFMNAKDRILFNACNVIDGDGIDLDEDMLECVFKGQQGLFVHLLMERERKWITAEYAEVVWQELRFGVDDVLANWHEL
jgi:hypothetical protein